MKPVTAVRRAPARAASARAMPAIPLTLDKILVPLDFTEESMQALRVAEPFAALFGAEIHLVYVGEDSFSEITIAPPPLTDAQIAARMKEQVESCFGITLAEHACHLRHGRPFHEIVELAAEIGAGLIIIATHASRRLNHLLRRSTAGQVVRHSRMPVLVVRGEKLARLDAAGQLVLGKILVPLDFSTCSRAGAEYAARLAAAAGADLLLMHVVQPPLFVNIEDVRASADWPRAELRAILDADRKLERTAASLPRDGFGIDRHVAVGLPFSELAKRTRAEDIDLVVTSTHGHTGLRHLFMGSTAEKLLRTAECPVLVVPSHE